MWHIVGVLKIALNELIHPTNTYWVLGTLPNQPSILKEADKVSALRELRFCL